MHRKGLGKVLGDLYSCDLMILRLFLSPYQAEEFSKHEHWHRFPESYLSSKIQRQLQMEPL